MYRMETELGVLRVHRGEDGNIFIQQHNDILVLTEDEAERLCTVLDVFTLNEEEE